MRVASGKGGFTLIELMVVVAIIGIISSVMVAEMRGTFEDTILRATARKIMDACDAANNRAISVGEAQLLRIDTGAGRFAIVPKNPRENENGELAAGGEVDTAGDAGALDTRITLSIREPEPEDDGEGRNEEVKGADEGKPRDVIPFYPDGTCEAREFLLRDRAGVELVLRINPVTSRVRILEAPAQ